MIPETVSVEQACELLGCKRRQLFKLLAAGTISAAPRLGRKLRIFRESIARAQSPEPESHGRKRRSRPVVGVRIDDVPVFER